MNKRNALIIISSVLIVLVLVVPSLCFLMFESPFKRYYLDIVNDLNLNETKNKVRDWFERDYTYIELLYWVNDTLVFDETYTDFERPWRTDPSVIKEIGRGQCGEFGILYVSVCLAHGYDSRLVVATNVSDPNSYDPHVWAEIKDNDTWVHVDPSEVVWNDPYRYEKGPWGNEIGSTVKIYAFDKNECEDVTNNYRSILDSQ